MTVNRTTLLDLPLPVTGTESGTWGDTTNNGLTQYMDIAIAGMSNLTSANFTTGALTIETTEGDSTATNISATSAQYAGFRVTSLAQNSTITVGNTGTSPARSYRLINADATYTLTFKATGQTGITLQPGQTAVVAFNGTDYVIVGMAGAGTVTDNAIVRFDGTTGKLVQNSVVTIADSTGDISGVGQLNATTVDTTNLEVTNIKAKDGTAAATIADSTGIITVSTQLNVDNLNFSVNTISSTDTNGNIVLAPNGTGDVNLDADTVRIGDSGVNATLTTNGAGNLTINTNAGTNSGSIVINQGANGNIEVAPNGTGDVYLTADTVRIGDSAANATLTTNGAGDLILNTNAGTNSGSITIADGTNGNITITPNGTGEVAMSKVNIDGGAIDNTAIGASTASTGRFSSLADTGLTSGRVTYATTGGELTDSANLTFNGTDLTVSGAVNAGSVNATTLDLTNLEVTNIKAKDGTAAATIADSTGVVTVTAAPVMTALTASQAVFTTAGKALTSNAITGTGNVVMSASPTLTGTISAAAATLSGNLTLSGGTANGVLYLDGSKVATSGSALTFDGTSLGVNGRTSITSGSLSGSGNGMHLYFDTGTNTGFIKGFHAGVDDRAIRMDGLNLQFAVAGTEAMRLTSTGLGIGTSSPAYKLDVQGGNIRNLREGSQGGLQLFTFSSNQTYNAPRIETWRARGTAASPSVVSSGDELFSLQSSGYNASAGYTYAGGIFLYATGTISGANVPSYMTFDTSSGASGTERMRLDSSGNLGLGVTPSAWTDMKAIQINGYGSAIAAWNTNRNTYILSNAYWDGSFKFSTTATASAVYYNASGETGAHVWWTAGSAAAHTAGNAITFTQALTLDASGNLLLNGTSAPASSAGNLVMFNGTAPTGNVTNGCTLFCEDVSSSSELKVRDEAGNVTTLSPHNFSLIPEGPSEDMAWSYYSERDGRRINIDMLKAIRLLEKISGEQLVYEA